jgi:hypothetical protein
MAAHPLPGNNKEATTNAAAIDYTASLNFDDNDNDGDSGDGNNNNGVGAGGGGTTLAK